MMGFTLSRIALFACGAILMAAVAVPISEMYQDRGNDSMEKVAEADAMFINALWDIDMDETALRGDILLPSPAYGLVLDGYFLTISDDDGNSYVSSLKHRTDRIELGYGDSVNVCRYGDKLMLCSNVPDDEPVTVTDPLEDWDTAPPEEPSAGNSYTVTNESGNSITISCGPA